MTKAHGSRLLVLHAPTDTEWVSGVLLPGLGLPDSDVATLRDLAPGQSLLGELERLIGTCEVRVAVLTADFLSDPLSRAAEQLTAYLAYLEGRNRFVVLRLEDVEVPAYLRSRVTLDCRDPASVSGELVRLRQVFGAAAPSPETTICPYLGMVPFTREERDRFFGRATEVQDIRGRIRAGAALILVIGPSGSGKSSLLSAGVVPALEGDSWEVLEMRPAAAAALDLGQKLQSLPPGRRLLWIIDQFEEAFTGAHERLFESLRVAQGDARCAVILGMRADFFDRLMESQLWPVPAEQRIEIAPLSGDHLREAIRRPAQQCGWIVATELTERLMADVRNQVGALPFLQETLCSLWEVATRDGGRLLGPAHYKKLSSDDRTGLELAVAAKADAAMSALPSDRRFDGQRQRAMARRILLRLIHLGPLVTRRQQHWDDLRSDGDDPEELDATIRFLADHRILTTKGDRRVDLAHEALLSGWKTLQEWIRLAESAEQARRYYEDSALNWERRGSGNDGRLDAGEIAEIDRLRTSEIGSAIGITPRLSRLIDFSRERIRDEQAAELRRERRRTNVLAVAFVLTVVALGGFIWQYSRVQRQISIQQARQLLDRAREGISEKHDADELSALYARQAWLMNRDAQGPYEGEAYELMRSLLYDRTFVRELPFVQSNVESWALSPSGEWAATFEETRGLVAWNLRDPQSTDPSIFAQIQGTGHGKLQISNDGQAALLVSPCSIYFFDLRSARKVDSVSLDESSCASLALAPSGLEFALQVSDGIRRVRRDQPGAKSLALTLPPEERHTIELAYAPDERALAIVSPLAVRVWPLDGRDPSPPVPHGLTSVLRPSVAPSGDQVAFDEGTSSTYVEPGRSPSVRKENKEFVTFDSVGNPVIRQHGAFWVDDITVIERRIGPAPDGVRWWPSGVGIYQGPQSLLELRLPWQQATTNPKGTYSYAVFEGGMVWMLERFKGVHVWDPQTPQVPPRALNSLAVAICGPAGKGGVWIMPAADRLARLDEQGVVHETFALSMKDPSGECQTTPAADIVIRQQGMQEEVLSMVGDRLRSLANGPEYCFVTVANAAGTHFACAKDGDVHVWQAGGARKSRISIGGKTEKLALSPDGKWLAAVTGTAIRLARTDQPDTRPRTLSGHKETIGDLVFSPDGKRLVSGAYDATLRVWPVEEDLSPWILSVLGATSGLMFLDDMHLAYLNFVRVTVLDLDASRMADRICERVSRNLDEDEWKRAVLDRERPRTCPDLPFR